MTKKVYIIHGWGLDSNMPWIRWLEIELKKKNFEVFPLDMPNSFHPKIEEWVNYLRENVKSVDDTTYFVGHSIGAQTIMRLLEKFPKSEHIKGCVFIAPWLELIHIGDDEIEIAHPWVNSKIDFGRILKHTGNFLAIFSSDDPYVSENEIEKFKEGLNANIIIKKEMGHFDEVNKIPEILSFIK